MGLLSMEIGKHHNLLLSGFHLFSSDTFLCTELIPFQFVPQILTGYNPAALKIMAFIVFVLSVLAIAYLVWFVSKSVISALLFCALAAAIPPDGYFWLAYPTSHDATLLFGAVILIILFSLHGSRKEQNRSPRKTGKKKSPETRVLPWSSLLALAVLVFLSVFSDTIILVWVLVPFIVAYLFLFRTADTRMNSVIGAVVVIAAVAYIAKTYFMPDWIQLAYVTRSVRDIVVVNIPLYFRALFQFLNSGLSTLAGNTASMGPAEVLSLALFAGMIFLCVKNGWSGRDTIAPGQKLLYAFALASVLLMAAAFFVSGYAYDMGGARYLTFTALVLLMLVALSYPVTEKTCAVLVLLLLFISTVTGSMYVSTMDKNPNAREYDLITFLKDQDLPYGYAAYWDANIITYLSGEDVTVRPVYILPDDLRPFLVNSCDRWYTGRPDKFFLIYDTTRPDDESQMNYELLKKTGNASDVMQYRDYEVFLFHPA
jgi:hypothetical protein